MDCLPVTARDVKQSIIVFCSRLVSSWRDNSMSVSMSVSMLSLRWHLTNKSVTWAPYSIKRYSLSHSWTLWWRVRWLKQCRLEVTAELQQRWRRTNRRWKSIPRLSSSHRKGSITQRGASCGWYDQRRRRSSMLASLLWQCLTVPALLQLC